MQWRNFEFFCALDWGFNDPFACYWVMCIPDGRYHAIREWKQSGVFAEDFAQRFWKITRDDLGLVRPRYVVAGGDIANKSGLKGSKGESIKETLQAYGLPIKDADRDRKNGWWRMHEMLRPSPFGTPWLTFDPSCRYIIRTIAAAPSDKDDSDELEAKFHDDHGLDAIRYACMSRPTPTSILRNQPVGGAGKLLQEALRANGPHVLGADAVRRTA